MKTNPAPFDNSNNEFIFYKTTREKLFFIKSTSTKLIIKPPEILFLTSYPPRECGIATYSQDIISALKNQFENSFTCSICALESATEKHAYEEPPKYILNTDRNDSFAQTADRINKDANIVLVVMQHEFGFFAGNETAFKLMFEKINKPIVFVFHTVLPQPNNDLKCKVKEMGNIASSIIVMTKDAANILMSEYTIPEHKISVIPHGTHLVTPMEKEKLKELYNLNHRKVLSTFGLLSRSKNIETTLKALPGILVYHPDVMFLILGKTHPTVAKQEGEVYRNMLENLIKELGIKNNVRFVNEYLPLQELLNYLQLTDIYLFTSKDPHQAVSGTFSYAVSCGCPVISTPIPHAKEVLNNNNGIIINFESPDQLSKSVVSLLENKNLRDEISSNSLHKMASTAWQNSAIAHALLFEQLTQYTFKLNYRVPKLNLSHINKLTTDFAMIQFSKIANPDLSSGYTLDDNARALVAICRKFEIYHDSNDLINIKKYLSFIRYCLQPNGKFLNYVNVQKKFTQQNNHENLEDSNGRAIWALGFLTSLRKIMPNELVSEAELILE